MNRFRSVGQYRVWQKSGRAGFTLVEVLVALAVLGLVLGASLRMAGHSASGAARLESLALANWVALNQIAELQLRVLPPGPGASRDRVSLGGRSWYRTATVIPTADPYLYRVRIEVRSEPHATRPVLHHTTLLQRRR